MSEGVEDIAGQHNDEVFERYRPLLFSIAYSILGISADAQDMVQETLAQWNHRPANTIIKPRTFLVTTVASLCVDYLQYGQLLDNTQLPGRPAPSGTRLNRPQDLSVVNSISSTLLVMLNRLTPTERIIFLLRTVFNCDYAQIARTVGQDEAQCRHIAQRIKRYMARNRSAFAAFPALDVSQI